MLIRLIRLVRHLLSRVALLLVRREETTATWRGSAAPRPGPPSDWMERRAPAPPAEWLARVGATPLVRQAALQFGTDMQSPSAERAIAWHVADDRTQAGPAAADARPARRPRPAHALIPWAAGRLATRNERARLAPRVAHAAQAHATERGGLADSATLSTTPSRGSRVVFTLRAGAAAVRRAWHSITTARAPRPIAITAPQPVSAHRDSSRSTATTHAASAPHIPAATFDRGSAAASLDGQPTTWNGDAPAARDIHAAPRRPAIIQQIAATPDAGWPHPLPDPSSSSPTSTPPPPVSLAPSGWPILPQDPPRGRHVDVAAIRRELEREQRIDREQRGVSWNGSRF